MFKVKNITLEEYKSIVSETSHPLSFCGDWVYIASKCKPIFMLISEGSRRLSVFVACFSRNAVITTPFCKYQGWLLLEENISENDRLEIVKVTMDSLPKHYYFNLNISDEILSIELLKSVINRRGLKIEEKDFQILYINSGEDFKKHVSYKVRQNHKKAQSLGFEVNYSASKNDVINFSYLTAKRKGYKIDSQILSNLLDLRTDDITPILINISHRDMDMPSFGGFVVRYKGVSYFISCGYNDDVRRKLNIYQPNFYTYSIYDYINSSIEDIEAFDFQGSSIAEIRTDINRFLPSNKRYINIEYGYRYNPFRFL